MEGSLYRYFLHFLFPLGVDKVADKRKVRPVRRTTIAMAWIFVGRIRSALRFLLGSEMGGAVLVSRDLLIGSTVLFPSILLLLDRL